MGDPLNRLDTMYVWFGTSNRKVGEVLPTLENREGERRGYRRHILADEEWMADARRLAERFVPIEPAGEENGDQSEKINVHRDPPAKTKSSRILR